jgi:hypothetical protein
MKKFLILLLAAGLFTACENKSYGEETTSTEGAVVANTEESAEADTGLPDPDATGSFGAVLKPGGEVSVSEIPALLKGKDSVFVKVKGDIAAVCQKKGCWMTMPVAEGEDMQVRFKDYEFFVPMNSPGKEAIVEGWAYREEVPVEELRHYAEDEGLSKEDIAKITEPKSQFTFMADGVIVAVK